MQSALRIGRFGPITINLHYTWVFAGVLGLWWLALLWLPDRYPEWAGAGYWLVGVAVMLLYLLSVVLHEVVHTLVAGSGHRNLTLYPFGAAMPFRPRDLQDSAGRALASAIVGPAFNLLLGGVLMLIANSANQASAQSDLLVAFALPLSWLNLAVGLVNLIPGIPFDLGWAIDAAICWFSGDRETGARIARAIGQLATIVLALVGAWRGLTSQSWLDALALVMLAWAARQAVETNRQRSLLQGTFEGLRARDFMEPARLEDAVRDNDSVADMVADHPHYTSDTPLPVFGESQNLVGLVTLGSADTLLQGVWPTTPITALMDRPDEIQSLDPDAPLSQVIALIEERPGSPSEQPAIPVLANGRFIGHLDPGKVQVFEDVDEGFGVDEMATSGEKPTRILAVLSGSIPGILIIAVMAILGSAALRSNPYDVRGAHYSSNVQPITIKDYSPSDGASIAEDTAELGATILGARAVTTASIFLDGASINTTFTGTPLQRNVAARATDLAPGEHTIMVIAVAVGGEMQKAQWQFWVGDRNAATETPEPEQPAVQRIANSPAPGAHLLAGTDSLPASVDLISISAPTGAQVNFDGVNLDTKVEAKEGTSNRFSVRATLPALTVGEHHVSVIVTTLRGTYTGEWTFSALQPDANNVYFKETGYFVSGPFLKYWQDKGGLAIFGYPISDMLQESDRETSTVYATQYFERARFELHPETGDQVILGRLGAILGSPETPAAPLAGAQFFPETGHNLSGPFLAYWNAHGGLAIFGYPITEERTEKSALDGKEYKVQYFERNRFELHPEFAGTPNEVQLGQLGRELYDIQLQAQSKY